MTKCNTHAHLFRYTSGTNCKTATYGVGGVDQLPGLAELDQTLLELVEGPLHQNFLLLVVSQQVVPQRVAGEDLGVTHDDHAKPGTQDTSISLNL